MERRPDPFRRQSIATLLLVVAVATHLGAMFWEAKRMVAAAERTSGSVVVPAEIASQVESQPFYVALGVVVPAVLALLGIVLFVRSTLELRRAARELADA